MQLKPGDVVKVRGPDGRPTGPAMVIADRSRAIASSVCWECVWHWNGSEKRRAFVESSLLPVAIPKVHDPDQPGVQA
jgi:uncharacterized protein YodC (DUF2158 family)